MNTRIATTLALLLASATAAAHGPAEMDRQVCLRTERLVQEAFDFTPTELKHYADCLNPPAGQNANCTSSVPTNTFCSIETCGDFDDDYGIAKRMVINYCAAASAQPASFDSDAVTVAATSTAFNSNSHHDAYDFREGLAGICQYCEPLGLRQSGD